MIYAVSKYADHIRTLKEEVPAGFTRFHYFDDKEEAKYFIRQRAQIELKKAEKAVKAATRRLKSVTVKFAPDYKSTAADGSPKS